MSARYSDEFTPKSAERLLDGQARGPEPLARLLSAAAAPGRPHELAGEDTAVAAFGYHHVPGAATAPRRAGPRRAARSPLTRLLTAKVLALVVGVGATGGVALAAADGAFSGSPAPAPPPIAASPLRPYTAPSARATDGPARTQAPAASSAQATTGPASPRPQVRPQGPAALCRELAGQVVQAGNETAGLEQALASSGVPGVVSDGGYVPLVQAAGNALAVPDYCALLLRLPALPQPGEITRLPAGVLAALLTGLPAGTLGQVLTGLPAGTLGQVLTGLPAGTLDQVLGKLPLPDVSRLLARLPAATVSRILAELPSSVVPGIKAGLPAPLASKLPLGGGA